jgi:glycosyltransferase involved in cell wall biosynthesis
MPTLPAPVVDVVLPAYNGAAMIRGALESALAQDVALRIIVVDDGSKDDSAEIARSYGERIHVIRQANQGVSGARNTALAAATAPYVAFLDQDDVWKPGKLARQVALMETRPDVGMVFTDMAILEPGGKVLEEGVLAASRPYSTLPRQPIGPQAFLFPEQLGDAIARDNFISPSTTLVRREALAKIGGFDTAFRLADDAECWMRLFRHWQGIAIEEPLVLSYFWGGNASTVRAAEMQRERLRIGAKVLANPDLYSPGSPGHFRREVPIVHYRLGIGAMQYGNIADARTHLRTSLQAGWTTSAFLAWIATVMPGFIREPLLKLKRAAGVRWRIGVE